MVTSACGGNILKKTYEEDIGIIIELADDSRQYFRNARNVSNASNVSKVDRDDYDILKEEVRRLKLKATNQQVNACGICQDEFHPTDACPTMQEDVNAIGGFHRQGAYNGNGSQPWRSHPNFSWSNPNNQLNPPFPTQQAPRPQDVNPSQNIEATLNAVLRTTNELTTSMTKMGHFVTQLAIDHKTTKDQLANLEKNMAQLTETVG